MFLVTSLLSILVFPLVSSSPVLVEERNLGCQCSSEPSTKVGERTGGQVMTLVDICREIVILQTPLEVAGVMLTFSSAPVTTSEVQPAGPGHMRPAPTFSPSLI